MKKINMDKPALRGKIDILKGIQKELEEDIKIPCLMFGAKSIAKSSGQSSEEMKALNLEYASAAVSMAQLVAATVGFLEDAYKAFEDADNAQHGKQKNPNQKKGG